MERRTKQQLFELLRPPLLALGFLVKVVWIVLCAWWFNPWARRKANAHLMADVKSELFCVTSQQSAAVNVLRETWPTIRISWSNLLITVVRFRGDVTVSVAPRHLPAESYELGPVIAALEHRHFSQQDVVNTLPDAGNLLRPRLQALNAAFSPQEFSQIRSRI